MESAKVSATLGNPHYDWPALIAEQPRDEQADNREDTTVREYAHELKSHVADHGPNYAEHTEYPTQKKATPHETLTARRD